MASASRLYAELVGEGDDYDDYDDFSEEEEYEEDYEPVHKEEMLPSMPKIRREVPMYRCQICESDIPLSERKTHESSKRHLGAVVDARVRSTLERADALARALWVQKSQAFRDCFVPKIREKVFAFLPAVELLRLRLVCKDWKEYLSLSDTWM